MNNTLKTVSKRRLMVVGAVVAAVLLTLVAVVTRSEGSVDQSRPIFEAQRGPLTISVGVSGTIKALDQEIIKNEVEGQTTILYIIPEGTRVKEGDLLVELDASGLQDQLVAQEIKTQNAEAAYINARETLDVVRNQSQSDVNVAELEFRFANEDLVKFKEGDFPLQAKEAEAKVTLAKGDLRRAQDKVEGSRKLAERKFITPMELEADEQAAVKAQLDVEMAEEQMKLLRDFEYRRQLAQLESDAEQARLALERVKKKANADIVQAEAGLKAKELEYEREKSMLEKYKQQIVKTKRYAPREGLVVYATTGQGGYRGNAEPLQEGQNVRERQELIYLPRTNSYKAEAKVHESSLAKVAPGLPVTITVDAIPGRTFQGRVDFISPLPDAQSVWMNPDLKVYNTDIILEGDTEGLRTGMSCRGEILVKNLDDAIYVPVQAVVRESGEPTVYVVEGQKVNRRKVALGLDNNRMVQITEGLKQGETVLLAPPLAADEMTASGPRPAGGNGDAATGGTAAPSSSASNGTGAATSSETPSAAPQAGSGGTASPAATGGEGGPRRAENGAGGDLRSRFQNATPEERERMRAEWEQRMQNMTPEEREQMRQQRRQRGGGGEGGGEGRRGPE